MPRPIPMPLIVPDLEEVVLETAKAAAALDPDIFANGTITVKVRTYRKHRAGDASPQRVVQLYIHRGMDLNELIDTIAHELRHIGQFTRRIHGGEHNANTKKYRNDPVEIDSRQFGQAVLKAMEQSGVRMRLAKQRIKH